MQYVYMDKKTADAMSAVFNIDDYCIEELKG